VWVSEKGNWQHAHAPTNQTHALYALLAHPLHNTHSR
jgi:hypothetical protein